MTPVIKPAPALRRLIPTALVAAGIAMAAATAQAGECPAGQAGANALSDRATEPSGVTDTVLTSIDLGAEIDDVDTRHFRLRQLVIQPGGIVPFHEHADRPAIIYVLAGEVKEFSSDCLAPIVHKGGEVSTETHGVSHWWRNDGPDPVVLLSADLLRNDPQDMAERMK